MCRRSCLLIFLVCVSCVTALTGIASAQDAVQNERGAELLAAQRCLACHALAGKGNKNGPLDDVGARLSADEIREWIVNGAEMMIKTKAQRKPAMPSYLKLEKDDLDVLVAYLYTQKGQ